MGKGIAGYVAQTGKLLNIRNAYNHPLFYKVMLDFKLLIWIFIFGFTFLLAQRSQKYFYRKKVSLKMKYYLKNLGKKIL